MTAQIPDLDARLALYREQVNVALDRLLPSEGSSQTRLTSAMRYSAIGGGKRIRPILVYATGRALGVPLQRLDTPACAVELMHAYSLVHDDLPAMDNDDLRRGMPTCHKQFDEASAILAGDALQALAFTLLAVNDDTHITDSTKLEMIRQLGMASGADGMAAGQAIDLEAVGNTLTLDELEAMHRLKTGALIRASIRLATLVANPADATINQRLDNYADAVGLAFQIVDDILDVTSDTEVLGKTQGADQALNKPTFPSLLGLDGARQRAQQMHQMALDALDGLDEQFDELRALSMLIIERSY